MRLTSLLLVACASSAFGQFKRFTNTSIPTVEPTASFSVPSSLDTTTGEATTTSSSLPPPQPVSLGTAQLGRGASYTTALDGSAAVLVPFLASLANLRVYVIFSIFVRPPRAGLKRAFEGCSLEVQLDGKVIYTQVMTETGGQEVKQQSNPTTLNSSGRPDIQYFLTCGSDAVEVVVSHLSVTAAGEDATTAPIQPLPTDTESAGITDTNSEGATTNSEGETIQPSNTAAFTDTNSEGATTNSEGETVIPTNTNSAGFTTNSNGETIFPTQGANTNSAGFTTDSNSETIFPTGAATGTNAQSSASPTSTSTPGFPDFISSFTLFGCVGSNSGFPTFEFAESDPSMDLDRCSTLCQGRFYFGVYDTDCYCGDEVDGDDTSRVSLNSCDIECPGDDSQTCGGDSRRRRLVRRQAVPNDRLLTVYVSAGGETDVVTNAVTRTVTDQSTFVTTFTTTVPGPETTTTDRVVYIFVEVDCGDCDGQWVYVPEACSICQGGLQYVPKFCFGGSCSGITVYKTQECHDWWNHKNFYVPVDSEDYLGQDVIYQPWENSWGTPENCKAEEIPACEGRKCPPTYKSNNGQNGGGSGHHGGSSKPGIGPHSDSNGGSGSGEHGGSSNPGSGPHSGSNGGSSSGNHGNGSNSNAPGCTGDDCNGPYGGESTSKPNGSNQSNGSGSHDETSTGSKPNGSNESNGSGPHGETASGSKPTGAPIVVSGASKQVVSLFALLAALAHAGL
ncbi:hypothetical protein IL306_000340 [Fusarium sp. DS 682]|nr:hypothetical protein IL306_000340 [Fusarium sp. DS 682]